MFELQTNSSNITVLTTSDICRCSQFDLNRLPRDIGNTVVEWLAFLPYTRNIYGLIPQW